MHLSIRSNYLLSFLFLCIGMILLSRVYGSFAATNAALHSEETALYQEAEYIAHEYQFNMDSLSDPNSAMAAQMRSRFKSRHAMTGTRFWITDRSGTILIDSESSDNLEGININSYNSDFLNQTTFRGHISRDLLPDEIFSVIYPLSDELRTNAYLIMISPMTKMYAKGKIFVNVFTMIFIIFLVILSVTFLYLYNLTERPLRLMTERVKQYSNENFEQPEKLYFSREYRELAFAIDYLTRKIRNAGETQRKFVGNVSHDFRSPLTSIKGYTEAMLDGTIPPELQEKYLNIILYETNRLTKLTGSLLELSQLESNGIPLQLTAFDIHQVIKNTTSAFEQRCTQKKIQIKLVFTKKTLPVIADISKIEQVIQNLVDNAIKFSRPNSVIEIYTIERSGKASISVKDHGIGIPKDNLHKIWNQFYKTDQSRGRDETGTGLGLSITKEIIEAHHEHINVVSTEGIGTEFTFSLKEADPS